MPRHSVYPPAHTTHSRSMFWGVLRGAVLGAVLLCSLAWASYKFHVWLGYIQAGETACVRRVA